MDIEQLLKPRFKVLSDYPHRAPEIGSIIDFGDGYSTKPMTTTPYDDHWGEYNFCTNQYHADEFEKYPLLFKKLEWWEERTPETIAQYVKWADGLVGKVSSYRHGNIVYLEGTISPYQLNRALPATEQDYINYQSTLK